MLGRVGGWHETTSLAGDKDLVQGSSSLFNNILFIFYTYDPHLPD
jgi:hypothetical protein